MNWFECKVKTKKMQDNGLMKDITEPYLVDALNFTEAEARIIEEISPYCNGELVVEDIKRAKISEIFDSEKESADRWYKAKCVFLIYDEKTEKEKRSASFILVHAHDFHEALAEFDKGMANSMADYEIEAITETKLVDIFKYKNKE